MDNLNKKEEKQTAYQPEEEEFEEEEEEEDNSWEDWTGEEEEEAEGSEPDLLCLFCDSKYSSSDELFQHCSQTHHFDFKSVKKELNLDFYGCFKLINYIRSQVAEVRCWCCGHTFPSNQDLQNHVHKTFDFKGNSYPWNSDLHLKPFMEEDVLLYSFDEDEEGEDNCTASADKEELIKDIANIKSICIDDDNAAEALVSGHEDSAENLKEGMPSTSNGHFKLENSLEAVLINCSDSSDFSGLSDTRTRNTNLKVPFLKGVAKEIKNVNKNYFDSYSSFGIHREMISDKVRTDAYRQAIQCNPSLFKGAVVMDVGCGTGILSLFAAQAGASMVIAVEASTKMAAVATQIAKDNGLLWSEKHAESKNQLTGGVRLVQGMVEELEKSVKIEARSVDVLISEWMGYCLLYETMLSSVLFARDRWLKPGGAILPDTATMFVAGFGRGCTSIPFWENVYGLNMSCIGNELFEDAAQNPIVDIVDARDIVTNSVVLNTFDLAKMKPDDMDFTASIELEPKLESFMEGSANVRCEPMWCYGVVLWFDTEFSSRFCKETPTVLSTSPFTPKTHWSQTILTFRKPIAMALMKHCADRVAAIGTEVHPATRIHLRISISRAIQHRSIDISLEATVTDQDGRKESWPAQIFNL